MLLAWGVGRERGHHPARGAPVLPHSGSSAATRVSGAVPLSRKALPLPSLIAQRTTSAVYGLAALDDRGRVADRVALRALGWSAGLRLTIDESRGLLVVYPDAGGAFQITGQGHLRCPLRCATGAACTAVTAFCWLPIPNGTALSCTRLPRLTRSFPTLSTRWTVHPHDGPIR